MTRPAGVVAIGEAVAEAVAELEGEQLALLPFADAREKTAGGALRVGRPAGARNLATRRTVEFVRRVCGDPMVESARWLLLTPAGMAEALHCTRFEAFQVQEDIRKDLRRYCYAPLAAVDGDGHAVVPLFQLLLGGHAAGGGAPPWLTAPGMTIVQNQGVSEPAPEPSHTETSHEDDLPCSFNDLRDLGK